MNRKPRSIWVEIIDSFGEMAERLNAAVLKTVISRDRDRGFESLSLLHSFFNHRKLRTFVAADKFVPYPMETYMHRIKTLLFLSVSILLASSILAVGHKDRPSKTPLKIRRIQNNDDRDAMMIEEGTLNSSDASPISRKRLASEEGYERDDAMMLDDADETSLAKPSKNMHFTMGKTEEDRLLEEYSNLVALFETNETACYLGTPETIAQQDSQKKRSPDDDSVQLLCKAFKKVEITTRKQEEEDYFSQLAWLTGERSNLDFKYQPGSEQYKAALSRIQKSFALLEVKGKILRGDTHPAMDLKNQNWQTDTYWQ